MRTTYLLQPDSSVRTTQVRNAAAAASLVAASALSLLPRPMSAPSHTGRNGFTAPVDGEQQHITPEYPFNYVSDEDSNPKPRRVDPSPEKPQTSDQPPPQPASPPKKPTAFQPIRRKPRPATAAAAAAASPAARHAFRTSEPAPTGFSNLNTAIANPTQVNPSISNPARALPSSAPSAPALRSVPPLPTVDHPAIAPPSLTQHAQRPPNAHAVADAGAAPKASQQDRSEKPRTRGKFVKVNLNGGQSKSIEVPHKQKLVIPDLKSVPSSQRRSTRNSRESVPVVDLEAQPSVVKSLSMRARNPRANSALNRVPPNPRVNRAVPDPAAPRAKHSGTLPLSEFNVNGRSRSQPRPPQDVHDLTTSPTRNVSTAMEDRNSTEDAKTTAAAAAVAAAVAADPGTDGLTEEEREERKRRDAVKGRHPVTDLFGGEIPIPRKASPATDTDAPKVLTTPTRGRVPARASRERAGNGRVSSLVRRAAKADKPINVDAPPTHPASRTPAKRARSSPTQSNAEDIDASPEAVRKAPPRKSNGEAEPEPEVQNLSESDVDDVVAVAVPVVPLEVVQRDWVEYEMKQEELDAMVDAKIEKRPFLINLYYMGICDDNLEAILDKHFPRLTFSRNLILRKNRLKRLSMKSARKMSSLDVGKLDLSWNEISFVAPEIRMLSSLRRLMLEGNQLTRLPDEVCQLKNLEVLQLGDNKLEQLPKGFRNLTKLRILIVSYNKLTGLPKDFAREGSKIHSLNVTDNDGLSEVPECFKYLSNLVNFDIDRTKLHSLLLEKEVTRKPKLWLPTVAGKSAENLQIRKKTGKFPEDEEDKDVVEVRA